LPRGGYRPGAGRKKGAKDKAPRQVSPESEEKKKLREMLAYDKKAKAKFYQEFLVRASKGESLSISEKKLMDKLGTELAADLAESAPEQEAGNLDAYDYLRSVWNDPKVEAALRIRAAEVVFRAQAEGKGKKELSAERAKNAGRGRFAPSGPPKLVEVK